MELLSPAEPENQQEQNEILTRGGAHYVNDLYRVTVVKIDLNHVWLRIRRRDGARMLRDWHHFQAIKNQLVGAECEGIELYPAESRKVDVGNEYHMFCCHVPGWRFPFGWVSAAGNLSH